ncbi:archease [Ferruginivarius sediminum]|uniref:Archease n=1 Tax=Ferruginivarius sediminum TaxID=2661937 RepID=A0A369TA42_9PROT|nr:archease [Ferruginivarius sediminum]RDD61047.1 archease [Ferruginivarius sediminum]
MSKLASTDGAAGWEHFEHGADVGLRAWGPTLEAMLEQAGIALTAAVTCPASVRPSERIAIEIRGRDPETLLYDWLNSLVYEMAVDRLLFARFQVHRRDGGLAAEAWGEPIDVARHAPAVEVKGATYTALNVSRLPDGGWLGECVIDV